MTDPTPGADSVRYFPAVCAAGHRPYVVRVELPATDLHSPPCPACGGEGRFIPGAYYSEAFVENLERAIDIVYSARLPALVAQEAAQVLGQCLADPVPARVRAVLARYDGLHPLRGMLPDVATASNQKDLRNLIGLMAALLPACAPPFKSAKHKPDEHAGEHSTEDDAPLSQQISMPGAENPEQPLDGAPLEDDAAKSRTA